MLNIRTGEPFRDDVNRRVHAHHRPSIECASIEGWSGRARGLVGGAFMGTLLAQQGGESVHKYAWCKSDGSAWIDLPVRCGCDLSWEVDIEIPSDYGTASYGNFFGGRSAWASSESTPRYTSYLYINRTVNKLCSWYVGDATGASKNKSIQIAVGARFRISGDNSTLSWAVNGSAGDSPSPASNTVISDTSTIHMGMFATLMRNTGDVATPTPPSMFRSAKVWKSGTLVFDAEFRLENGVGVVYNAVDGTKMQTYGTGTLTVGDDE